MAAIHSIRVSGDVLAKDISEQEFMARYGEQDACEWADGCALKLPESDTTCEAVSGFLSALFTNYFAASGQSGTVAVNPLLKTALGLRRPDIVVHDSMAMSSPIEKASLVVEISTPESHRRDRVEKFLAYEATGIQEYWLIDVVIEEVLFYQLDSNGLYELAELDEAYLYHSVALPRLQISPEIFWNDKMPDASEVIDLAKAMLR